MERNALITGASRGIGRGIALALAPLGWNLLLNYARNAETAAQTAADCEAAARTRSGVAGVTGVGDELELEPELLPGEDGQDFRGLRAGRKFTARCRLHAPL